MKKVLSMSDLFERLNDLKIVFKYGEKLIPIIQSIIDFMKETVPLLEDINTSIAESTSKIPKAKDQISNISSATELATTEILDIVDSISNDITSLEKKLKESGELNTEKDECWERIKQKLGKNAENIELINKYESLNQSSGFVPELLNNLGDIKQKVYNITLSLQVQDITSQQLAAVNHLIESVRKKLSSLVLHLDDTDISQLNSMNVDFPDDTTFNPDAYYSKSTDRQELADDLVEENKTKTSQDEIDKLFS